LRWVKNFPPRRSFFIKKVSLSPPSRKAPLPPPPPVFPFPCGRRRPPPSSPFFLLSSGIHSLWVITPLFFFFPSPPSPEHPVLFLTPTLPSLSPFLVNWSSLDFFPFFPLFFCLFYFSRRTDPPLFSPFSCSSYLDLFDTAIPPAGLLLPFFPSSLVPPFSVKLEINLLPWGPSGGVPLFFFFFLSSEL